MMICKKCGCALNERKGIMPRFGPYTTGPGSHTAPQRSDEQVMADMKKRRGIHYTCPNSRWYKFWEEHDDLWEKL